MKLRTTAACALIPLLCSCAATSLKSTWKAPDYQGGPLTKLAVLAVDERIEVRQAVESRLAVELQKGGASAFTCFDRLSLPQINQDKPGAAQRLRADGATVVVILRLRDISSTYRESRPGYESYAGVTTGYEPGVWYDYYSVAYTDMGVTYGNLKQRVYLETSIYDLTTAKRLWSALTKTVVGERMDKLTEADRIAAKVVAAMRKDGVAP